MASKITPKRPTMPSPEKNKQTLDLDTAFKEKSFLDPLSLISPPETLKQKFRSILKRQIVACHWRPKMAQLEIKHGL